jgi:NAD+ synthase (glutamine-hydrolysing)
MTFAEIDVTESAKLVLIELDDPFVRGEKLYDVTVENVQAGLAPTTCSGSPTSAAASCLASVASRMGTGLATYGVGDRMSH